LRNTRLEAPIRPVSGPRNLVFRNLDPPDPSRNLEIRNLDAAMAAAHGGTGAVELVPARGEDEALRPSVGVHPWANRAHPAMPTPAT
jgi:hypothetical protein